MNWIRCSERLPEVDCPVLCYCSNQHTQIMEYWFDDEEGKPVFYNPPNPSTNSVSHWMLLPNPPKKEEE